MFKLSEFSKIKIDYWISKFPSNQRHSSILASLLIVQNENHGALSTHLINLVSDYLKVSRVSVYEVATFYSMYEFSNLGRFCISVCTSLSCSINGSDDLMSFYGENKKIFNDNFLYVKPVECLAACGDAPVVFFGSKYYLNVNVEKFKDILKKFSRSK